MKIAARPNHLRTVLFLYALAGSGTATSNEIADEPTRLAALLREFDAIERLATAGDLASNPASTRYHFNYAQLRADISRVTAGIKDYLTPPRATPRDVVVLHGGYTVEATPDQ